MAGTETVVVVREPKKDGFGNVPAGAVLRYEVPGWQFAPARSAEMGIGGGQVETDGALYGPPVADINLAVPAGIQPTDKIEVRGDPYNVIGRIQDWGTAGSVVILKLVVG
jgi:hypothetical protein